jgi:hypothetical protein
MAAQALEGAEPARALEGGEPVLEQREEVLGRDRIEAIANGVVVGMRLMPNRVWQLERPWPVSSWRW